MKINKLKNILTNLLAFKVAKHRKYWYNNVEGSFKLMYKFKKIENKISKLIKQENKTKHIDGYAIKNREKTILLTFLIEPNWKSNNKKINIGASDYAPKLKISPDELLNSIINILNNIYEREKYFSEKINSFSLNYNILENTFIVDITIDLYHKTYVSDSDRLINMDDGFLYFNSTTPMPDLETLHRIEPSIDDIEMTDVTYSHKINSNSPYDSTFI